VSMDTGHGSEVTKSLITKGNHETASAPEQPLWTSFRVGEIVA